MKTAVCAGALLALCLTAGSSYAASTAHHRAMKVPAFVKAAVDDPSRPDEDRKRDSDRKPAEVLTFAGIKPGQKIGELNPARGYYTRLLCRIVGDSGHVDGVNFIAHMTAPPPGAAPRPRPPAQPPMAPIGCNNVTMSRQETTALMLPSGLDVVWTSENYHDFHNPSMSSPDMRMFDQTIYDALKPGGIFIVEDHVAPAGSGASDTNTLHRIDPDLVKMEVEAVGFKLVGQSNVLHNPADTHTAIVFTMVDKTDRFLFKFQKPKS